MSDPGTPRQEPDLEALLLLGEGRVRNWFERLRLVQGASLRAGRTAAALVALTWLPLLVLAGFQGLALGERVPVPFLRDFLPYGQFLLAVPILVLGEVVVCRQLAGALTELRHSGVLDPQDLPSLDATLIRVLGRWRGTKVNVTLAVLSAAISAMSLWGAQDWLSGGWQYFDGRMTAAGGWYLLISVAVLRFLALEWLWRLALWTRILARIARLSLRPRPIHPDRAGAWASWARRRWCSASWSWSWAWVSSSPA